MDLKHSNHVMTLANSIIGVSILAMPYCFKQCGIFLSIILLIISSIISRLTCHFLLKSAIKVRLRTFEFLAFHVFGSLGKLFVELGMIGFLIGTCIAFFVVIGDLGPQILAEMNNTETTSYTRTIILVVIAVFCVLPLGLLRNVDSLTTVCTATIGFYACLVLKIMGESVSHLLLADWIDKVEYWRPAGILQCIPIFSMALFCQSQLFEIYQAIPNASLEKMNDLVRVAVNICTCVYIFVGVFGYIALSHETIFGGNILLSFQPSIVTEIMKFGFILSLAFSFPLVIFPCRASLYSLIYKRAYTALHEPNTLHIPDDKFKLLTVIIVMVSLLIGILIPNIEFVLGLVGSTIGVLICIIFPTTCFICLTSKNTNERVLAQLMLFVGITMMFLGTYANIYAMEQVQNTPLAVTPNSIKLNVNFHKDIVNENKLEVKDVDDQKELEKEKNEIKKIDEMMNKISEDQNVRHEPPQPVEPVDVIESKPEKVENKPVIKVETAKTEFVQMNNEKTVDNLKAPPTNKPNSENSNQKVKETDSIPSLLNNKLNLSQLSSEELNKPKIKNDEVDKEAIAKEDNEIKLEIRTPNLADVQKQLVEQKKVLDKLQSDLEKRDNIKEVKLQAVKNIENLVKLAVKSIADIQEEDKTSKLPRNDGNLRNLSSDKMKANNITNTKNINNLPPIPIALANINLQQKTVNKGDTLINNNKIDKKEAEIKISQSELKKGDNSASKDDLLNDIQDQKPGHREFEIKPEISEKKNEIEASDKENKNNKAEIQNEDSKNIRRDILSSSLTRIRKKREINEQCSDKA